MDNLQVPPWEVFTEILEMFGQKHAYKALYHLEYDQEAESWVVNMRLRLWRSGRKTESLITLGV